MIKALALLLFLVFKVFGRLAAVVIITVLASALLVSFALVSSTTAPATTPPEPNHVLEQGPARPGEKPPCNSS